MHHVIAGVETHQLFDRNRLLFTEPVVKPEFVIAFKDLVVSVEGLFEVVVRKPFMESL